MRLLKAIMISTVFLSCSKAANDTCEEVPLKDLAEYPIGAAFNLYEYQQSPSLREKWKLHYNRLTPESALKFGPLRPSPSTYSFWEADSLIALAYRNNAQVHGHTLIWHMQNPHWLENYSGDFETLLKEHISTVVSRYKNSIQSWDVLNEAITADGLLRNSIWKQKIGSDYIYLAFKAAQEANPNAELFYNDFNLSINPKKLNAVIDLCLSLKARGIHIAGIGMQMHSATSFPERRELAEAVEKIWRAGFKVHFSELDISVNIIGNKTQITNQDLQDQREKYFDIVSVFQQIPKEYQFGITHWGVGDPDSWLASYFNRIDAGLLFDEAYSPKPAYCGFKNALE